MGEKMKKNLKKKYVWEVIFGYILLIVLVVGSISVYYIGSQEQNRLTRENQGYVRYLTCIADIRNQLNVIAISGEISEACWQKAEQQTGIKLNRYDKSIVN